MAGLTQYRGYPIPTSIDGPDGLAQIRALAAAVDADVARLDRGYRLAAEVIYTATGSFSKTDYPGIKAIEVEVLAGGGGSGHVASTDATHRSVGTSGLGGAWAHNWFTPSDLNNTEDVIVGAGGAGGTNLSTSGDPGGDSSFGTTPLIGAYGGGGGTEVSFSTSATGFANAANTLDFLSAGTADLFIPGGGRLITNWSGGAIVNWDGLHGGAGAMYGQKLMFTGIGSSNVAGVSPAAPGSGASGGYNSTVQSALDGADGTAGLVIVRAYV